MNRFIIAISSLSVAFTAFASTPPADETETFLSYIENNPQELSLADTAAFRRFVNLNAPALESDSSDALCLMGRFWKAVSNPEIIVPMYGYGSLWDDMSVDTQRAYNQWFVPSMGNAKSLYERAFASGCESARIPLIEIFSFGWYKPIAERSAYDGGEADADKALELVNGMGDNATGYIYYCLGKAYWNTICFMCDSKSTEYRQPLENAAKYYAIAGDRGYDNENSYIEAASLYFSIGEFENGRACVEKIRDRSKAEYILADYYKSKPGKKSLWIKHSTAAADAGNAQAMWDLAEFLAKEDLNRRDYLKAAEYYRRAAETWIDNDQKARAYFNVARIYDESYLALENSGLDIDSINKTATEYYEKALALSSDGLKDKCLLGLGEMYRRKLVKVKEAEYYNRISPESPAEYCMSRVKLVECFGGLYKESSEVRRALSQLKGFTGDRFYKYYYLGDLYERYGKEKEAVGYYSEAIKAAGWSECKAVDAQLRIAKLNYEIDSRDYLNNFFVAGDLVKRFRSPKTYAWLAKFYDGSKEAIDLYKRALTLYVQRGADYYYDYGLPDWDIFDLSETIICLYSYYSPDLPSKAKIYIDYANRLGIGLPSGPTD